jgi:hypothetical protein
MANPNRQLLDNGEDSVISMSVEEALQVPWLSHMPKPLGELIREGYLDRSRLAWAAENAYKPELKQAAGLLLKMQKNDLHPEVAHEPEEALDGPIRDIGISLEQAGFTKWPFGQYRGEAMGPLVFSRRLELKDLAFAIEHAWDERVRRAAIALTLHRLDQAMEESPPDAGPLNVIANVKSYASRQQLKLSMLQGLIMGGVLGIVLMIFLNALIQQRLDGSPSFTLSDLLSSPERILALLIVIFGFLIVYWTSSRAQDWILGRLDTQIDAYQKGEAGEEAVVEKARRALDGNWTLFRNVVLPGKRKSDIDIVLVGPPGVWAIEVKALSGLFKVVGDSWLVKSGKAWEAMRKDPASQARRGALALKQFLQADGINTYVHDAVAWAEPQADLTIENPLVAVWEFDYVEDEFGNLGNPTPLPAHDRDRILSKLTSVCQSGDN